MVRLFSPISRHRRSSKRSVFGTVSSELEHETCDHDSDQHHSGQHVSFVSGQSIIHQPGTFISLCIQNCCKLTNDAYHPLLSLILHIPCPSCTPNNILSIASANISDIQIINLTIIHSILSCIFLVPSSINSVTGISLHWLL